MTSAKPLTILLILYRIMRLQIGILCDATTAGWDNNNKPTFV
jgi:hypothetical protein